MMFSIDTAAGDAETFSDSITIYDLDSQSFKPQAHIPWVAARTSVVVVC